MMTTIRLALPTRGFAWLCAVAEEKWAHLVQLGRLRETRRYVEQMDDHMLSDIGVSRSQVLFEIDRVSRWR